MPYGKKKTTRKTTRKTYARKAPAKRAARKTTARPQTIRIEIVQSPAGAGQPALTPKPAPKPQKARF